MREGTEAPARDPLAWRLQHWLIAATFRLLRALGPVRASNLGGWVARTFGPWLPVNRVGNANLRRAMPELDQAARRRILRGVWDNLGRTACELPHLPDFRWCTDGPGWEVVGEEPGLAAARGRPSIFVSGHFANWEVGIPSGAAMGLHVGLIYRAAANPVVDRLVQDMRRKVILAVSGQDAPMFPKGAAGARGTMAHLAGGGALGMLMDQKMNDGIPARFFGRTAMTAPALAALALRYRCPVVPACVHRLGPARFRVVFEPPLPLPDTGDRKADIAALTQAVNDRLEAWVRERPESWLWLHRRWPKEE